MFCFALPVAITQACNFSACIQETETGRSQVQNQHSFSILGQLKVHEILSLFRIHTTQLPHPQTQQTTLKLVLE